MKAITFSFKARLSLLAGSYFSLGAKQCFVKGLLYEIDLTKKVRKEKDIEREKRWWIQND